MKTQHLRRVSALSALALAASLALTACGTPNIIRGDRNAANLATFMCISNYSGQKVVVSKNKRVDSTSVTMKSGDVFCQDSAGGIIMSDEEVYITFVDRNPVPQEHIEWNNPWIGRPYISINGRQYALWEDQSGNVTVSDLNYTIKRSPDTAEFKKLTLSLLPS
jgi:hypothetical protein